MNTYDNALLFQMYEELDQLIQKRKDLKKYKQAPEGMTYEEALQELDEEEVIIRAKIEELTIVQSDYFDETF